MGSDSSSGISNHLTACKLPDLLSYFPACKALPKHTLTYLVLDLRVFLLDLDHLQFLHLFKKIDEAKHQHIVVHIFRNVLKQIIITHIHDAALAHGLLKSWIGLHDLFHHFFNFRPVEVTKDANIVLLHISLSEGLQLL